MSQNLKTTDKESSSSPSPTKTRNRGNPVKRVCGVCEDDAKSMHFGGLSCDSCKAFFRRSVHKDGYKSFSCAINNNCKITKTNRKNCQKCRFEKCLSIGMETKWVMSEEERHKMSLERKKKRRSPNQRSEDSQSQSSPEPNDDDEDYVPNVDDMLKFMTQEEQVNIQHIVDAYRVSYEQVPYETSTPSFKSSVRAIQMFTTILRRFACFAKKISEFGALPRNDQKNLLKSSALQMCLLRGALTFDFKNHLWPRSDFEFLKNCPKLKVEDMKNLVSTELFYLHMDFINRLQQLNVDEPVVMLLLVIVLFDPDDMNITEMEKVSAAQEKYSKLLQKYVKWRYGTLHSNKFAKLLVKLTDLRQLNDFHNEHSLNLEETDIHLIRNGLAQIQLEPYKTFPILSTDQQQASVSSGGNSSSRNSLQPQNLHASQISQRGQIEQQQPCFTSKLPPRSSQQEQHKHLSQGEFFGGHGVSPMSAQGMCQFMRETFDKKISAIIDDPMNPNVFDMEMQSLTSFVAPQVDGENQGSFYSRPSSLANELLTSPTHVPKKYTPTQFSFENLTPEEREDLWNNFPLNVTPKENFSMSPSSSSVNFSNVEARTSVISKANKSSETVTRPSGPAPETPVYYSVESSPSTTVSQGQSVVQEPSEKPVCNRVSVIRSPRRN